MKEKAERRKAPRLLRPRNAGLLSDRRHGFRSLVGVAVAVGGYLIWLLYTEWRGGRA